MNEDVRPTDGKPTRHSRLAERGDRKAREQLPKEKLKEGFQREGKGLYKEIREVSEKRRHKRNVAVHEWPKKQKKNRQSTGGERRGRRVCQKGRSSFHHQRGLPNKQENRPFGVLRTGDGDSFSCVAGGVGLEKKIQNISTACQKKQKGGTRNFYQKTWATQKKHPFVTERKTAPMGIRGEGTRG